MSFDRESMRWVARSSVNVQNGSHQNNSFLSMDVHNQHKHEFTSCIPDINSSVSVGPHFLETLPRKPSSRRTAKRQGVISHRRLTKPAARPKRRKGSAVGMHELAQNRMQCLLCEGNRREVLMVPCRHLCICRRCSVKEDNISKCPLCNCAVAGRMLIF